MSNDVYTRITAQILESLERGVKPWIQPWAATPGAGPVSRPLRDNGEPYSGINVLTLWVTAMERGFAAPNWMTFKQAQARDAHVRKGEKGAPVVFWSTVEKTDANAETGEETERAIPFLKAYTVFNPEQIDGLSRERSAPEVPATNPDQRIAEVEAFFDAVGANIEEGGDRAYYAPGPDIIRLPCFAAFQDAESYYATLAHECTHWTRHERRLDRSFGRERWGDAGYAREELVAELGAAFLCADLGITLEDREDHAAYIASWLTVLRNDKRAIFAAAAHAQRAVDYLKQRTATSRDARTAA